MSSNIEKRRCDICYRNYEDDKAIVLDVQRCTSCIIKGYKERDEVYKHDEELLKLADEVIDDIKKTVEEIKNDRRTNDK